MFGKPANFSFKLRPKNAGCQISSYLPILFHLFNLATFDPRPSAPDWAWLCVCGSAPSGSQRPLPAELARGPPSAQTAASVSLPNGIPLPSCAPEQPERRYTTPNTCFVEDTLGPSFFFVMHCYGSPYVERVLRVSSHNAQTAWSHASRPTCLSAIFFPFYKPFDLRRPRLTRTRHWNK